METINHLKPQTTPQSWPLLLPINSIPWVVVLLAQALDAYAHEAQLPAGPTGMAQAPALPQQPDTEPLSSAYQQAGGGADQPSAVPAAAAAAQGGEAPAPEPAAVAAAAQAGGGSRPSSRSSSRRTENAAHPTLGFSSGDECVFSA